MVIIIVGNHLASRTYYAIGELTTSYGKHVNCIYGFADSFRKIFKRFKDLNTFFFIVWDGPGKKRGHKLDPNYKANRLEFKDNFKEQLGDLRDLVSIFDIKQYRLKNIEADDVIGTIAIKSRKKGHKVKIISSDHDFEQLVTKHIVLLKPAMGRRDEEEYNSRAIKYKYKIEDPKQVVEILSLTGDSSDNVSGIPDCGEKTASRLLRANGNLENILNNVDELKIYNRKEEIIDASEKLKAKVKANIDIIKRNKEIVKLDCDLDINPSYRLNKPDFEQLHDMFEKLEFKKYLENFEQWKADFVV